MHTNSGGGVRLNHYLNSCSSSIFQLKMTRILPRPCLPAVAETLQRSGLHPVLARLYAARGICDPQDVEAGLSRLLSPDALKGIDEATALLAHAITARKKISVIADYDCDGATACAVAVRGLRRFGAQVNYLVPNRFEYGYGLSPEIVAVAAQRHPDVLITVDNGIASVEGVAAAQSFGIEVLITDHHLPGSVLPAARAIVNPNQPGCAFASKCLAGVGVMFYVLLALRAHLRAMGAFGAHRGPRLDDLLDLVALGTVADVVPLDLNNRILVAQGLARIRAGRMQPGIAALFRVAGREARSASSLDFGFALAPRLNAAGRLADMSLGIECLLTDDVGRAWALAQQLDEMNRARRAIEADMQADALTQLECLDPIQTDAQTTLTLFNSSWHPGVIGILAARLKERFFRPVIALAPADERGVLARGSGRSIAGFHLRDAFDWISKQHEGLLLQFGGHAMAAGLTIRMKDVPRLRAAFEAVGRAYLGERAPVRVIETDGDLEDAYFTPQFAALLDAAVWGQGFAAPLFSTEFEVVTQGLVKERHLKLQLKRAHARYPAIWFNRTEPLPMRAQVVYRLARSDWNGLSSVQLVVEHARAV